MAVMQGLQNHNLYAAYQLAQHSGRIERKEAHLNFHTLVPTLGLGKHGTAALFFLLPDGARYANHYGLANPSTLAEILEVTVAQTNALLWALALFEEFLTYVPDAIGARSPVVCGRWPTTSLNTIKNGGVAGTEARAMGQYQAPAL